MSRNVSNANFYDYRENYKINSCKYCKIATFLIIIFIAAIIFTSIETHLNRDNDSVCGWGGIGIPLSCLGLIATIKILNDYLMRNCESYRFFKPLKQNDILLKTGTIQQARCALYYYNTIDIFRSPNNYTSLNDNLFQDFYYSQRVANLGPWVRKNNLQPEDIQFFEETVGAYNDICLKLYKCKSDDSQKSELNAKKIEMEKNWQEKLQSHFPINNV